VTVEKRDKKPNCGWDVLGGPTVLPGNMHFSGGGVGTPILGEQVCVGGPRLCRLVPIGCK